MSKFNGRVNKLMLKMHFYVSHKDFVIVRDHLKEQLENKGKKPEDFKKECATLTKLFQKQDEKSRKEVKKIIEENYLAYMAHLYTRIAEDCIELPYGLWVPKDIKPWFVRLINDAKSYFIQKKKKG